MWPRFLTKALLKRLRQNLENCKCSSQEKQHQGHFTLWPKVEKPSISTNQIGGNQEFDLLTLHTRGQTPKVIALQNAYMAIFCLRRWQTLEGSLGHAWMETQTKVESRSIFSIKNKIKTIDKILAIRLEGLFLEEQMVWVWTLGLAFGNFTLCSAEGFTLCPVEDSNSCILLATIFSPVLWILNKCSAIQSHAVIGETFGQNNRLRSSCLQVQPVTCRHPTIFL